VPLDREQRREYQRAYRAKQAGKVSEPVMRTLLRSMPADVPVGDPFVPPGLEPVTAESLVRSELVKFRDVPPATLAAILGCARVLDDPKAVPQHVAAAGRLDALMDKVRAAKPAESNPLLSLRGGRGA
jgi:hypothetical protein